MAHLRPRMYARRPTAGSLSAVALVVVLVGLAFPSAGWAGSRFVSVSGSDSGACGSVSAACRSLGFAYRQAAPGDVVQLGPGSYGAQTIAAVSGRAGAQVEFRPAAGARVSFSSLDIRASYVTVRDFETGSLTVDDGGAAVHGVRVVRPTAKTLWINNAHDTQFLGGSFGGNFDDATVKISGATASTGLMFDGVVFHDALATNDVVHMECMWAGGVRDFVVRNSIFRNCTYFDIFFTTFQGPDPRDVLLENNVFEETRLWDGSEGYYSVMVPNWLSRVDNFTFRNNTLGSPLIFEPSVLSNVRVQNNLGEQEAWSCKSGVTYSHNVWRTGKCGSTDMAASGLESQFVDLGGHDWHLKAGAAAINEADPATSPATDRDGLTRNGPPDAGAHEFGGRRPASSGPQRSDLTPRPPESPAKRRGLRITRAHLLRARMCRRARHGCRKAVRLRLVLSERATVTLRLSRRVKHGWKPARTLQRRLRPGVSTIVIGSRGLRPGRYRLLVGGRGRGGSAAAKRTVRLDVRP